MVSSEKFNAPKLVNGSENRCSFIFEKKRRTSLVSSYSCYGLRYERLQVIRKIPARDQAAEACLRELASQLDRKSTRLNSSHSQISYAVFCLKKKKKLIYNRRRLLIEKDEIAFRVGTAWTY